MPRLTKSTALDRWLDAFADMSLEEQAFALAQVSAINRQAWWTKDRKPGDAEQMPLATEENNNAT